MKVEDQGNVSTNLWDFTDNIDPVVIFLYRWLIDSGWRMTYNLQLFFYLNINTTKKHISRILPKILFSNWQADRLRYEFSFTAPKLQY